MRPMQARVRRRCALRSPGARPQSLTWMQASRWGHQSVLMSPAVRVVAHLMQPEPSQQGVPKQRHCTLDAWRPVL